jgi:hypothetical protein
MAKGLISKLDKEDGKGDIGRHMLDINCNGIARTIIAIAPYNGY